MEALLEVQVILETFSGPHSLATSVI
jgi:hypothetical protein